MNGSAIITLDLHNKNIYQAKTEIDFALKRASAATYRIRLIHGHNSGTALKEMIYKDYPSNPKVIGLIPINPSTTDLELRKL